MASILDYWRISKVKLLLFSLWHVVPAVAADWWVSLVIPTCDMGLERIKACTVILTSTLSQCRKKEGH